MDDSGIMVANDGVNLSTGGGGLCFEPHQKIERLASLRSPCRDVSNLDQVSLFRNPALLGVDHPCHPQNGDEGVFIAVNITHGDDSPHTVPCILNFGGTGGPRR
jgi:hypothetical protein